MPVIIEHVGFRTVIGKNKILILYNEPECRLFGEAGLKKEN